MKLLILLSLGLVAAVSARSLTENEKREVFELFSKLNKGEDIYKKALGDSMIGKREQEAKLVTKKKRGFTHPPPTTPLPPRKTSPASRRKTTAAKRELEAKLIKKIQQWQGEKRESNGATHWEPEKKEAAKMSKKNVAETNVASRVQKRNESEGNRKDMFEDMVMERLNHINYGVEGLMVAPLMTKIINTLDSLGSVCDHVLMFLHAYLHEVDDLGVDGSGSGSGDYSDHNGPSPSPTSGEEKPPRPSPSAGEEKPQKPAPSAGEEKPQKPAPPAGEEKPQKPAPPAGEEKPQKPAPPAGEEKPQKPAPPAGEEEEENPAPASEEEEKPPKPAPASEEEEEQKPAPASEEEVEQKPAPASEEEEDQKPAPASEEVQVDENKGNGNSTSNTEWMEGDESFELGGLFDKRELLKRLLDVLQEKAKSKRSMRTKRNSRSKRNAWWDVDWPLIVDVCHGYYLSHDGMDF